MLSKPKPPEFLHSCEMISNFVYFNLKSQSFGKVEVIYIQRFFGGKLNRWRWQFQMDDFKHICSLNFNKKKSFVILISSSLSHILLIFRINLSYFQECSCVKLKVCFMIFVLKILAIFP
jgi:hypothetical protein